MKLSHTNLLATLLTTGALLAPPAAQAQVSIYVNIAPPPLLVYAQPEIPGDGYLWTPGYWRWSPRAGQYFWVPGTWVLVPTPGDLWTPGYWAFEPNGYRWHIGYWAPVVGFYGGLNYGHGYTGTGYQGGRWDGGVLRYNRAVSNVNTTIVHNVYNIELRHDDRGRHNSYTGGPDGSRARPTAAQRQLQAAPRTGPTADQLQHERSALGRPQQQAPNPRVAQGERPQAATPRPSTFTPSAARPVAHDAPAPRPVERQAPPARPPQAHPPDAPRQPPPQAPNQAPHPSAAQPPNQQQQARPEAKQRPANPAAQGEQHDNRNDNRNDNGQRKER